MPLYTHDIFLCKFRMVCKVTGNFKAPSAGAVEYAN